ncbi:DUF2806 domain-containing protein [Sphingomonas sp. DC2300-3]|uniref:DUF2806 domain-containing protein n=1 Tax=unclassified Sphingomonas TaxID=196159 RepID=UPI003CF75B7B
MSDEQKDEYQLSPVAIIDAVAPEGWKGTLKRVALQLGIGTRAGARLYAAGRDQQDTSEGKSIVSKALAEAVAREAVENPVMMERARARFLSEFFGKQDNLEAVLIGAAGHLHDSPSSTSEPKADDAATGTQTSDDIESNDDVPLDADWAAAFTREAEGATSDELRDRLSRVLAGEIRSPGAYPRSVLRQIAELEKSDIEAMRDSMPFRVGNAVFHLNTGEAPRITRLLRLADAGLVADAASGLSRIFEFLPDGQRFRAHTFGQYYGILIWRSTEGRVLRDFAPLNRAGQAVADLLDPDGEQEKQAIIDLGRTFDAEALEIALVRITSKTSETVSHTTIDWLKSSPASVIVTPSASTGGFRPFPVDDPFKPKSPR